MIWKWIVSIPKVLKFRYYCWRMLSAMRKEGWEIDEQIAVLLHLAGEIEVLPPGVKERLGIR